MKTDKHEERETVRKKETRHQNMKTGKHEERVTVRKEETRHGDKSMKKEERQSDSQRKTNKPLRQRGFETEK